MGAGLALSHSKSLNLIHEDPSCVKPRPGLNDELAASVWKMDPETKCNLIEERRGGLKPRDPEEAGREAAAAGGEGCLRSRR